MKKLSIIILLLLKLQIGNAQARFDESVLLDKLLLNASKQKEYVVIETPINFDKQEIFFTPDFLQPYTEPTIGVDSKKVKKLIKKLDFNYLRTQKADISNWELAESKLAVIKYIGNPSNIFDNVKRYSVAKPIYSQDMKTVFIYYEDICGFIDCGSSSVSVFKKCRGKWKHYITIPLTIS